MRRDKGSPADTASPPPVALPGLLASRSGALIVQWSCPSGPIGQHGWIASLARPTRLWIGGVGVSSAAPTDRERAWSLPGEHASIARARRAVVDTCVEWGYGVWEDAELIASELVTNALRHGRLESALRSEEHTSELQSRQYLVCRLL